jgi:predicted S18 family serine protease
MSDARQALRAAENAGAPAKSADEYQTAIQLLESAEQSLESRNYDAARQYATDARVHAIRAREQASAQRAE